MAHTPSSRNRKPRAGAHQPRAGCPSPPTRRGGGGSQWRRARLRQRGGPASESLPRAGRTCSLPWPQGALRHLRRKQLGARCPRGGARATNTFVPQCIPELGVRAEMKDKEKGNVLGLMPTPGELWLTLRGAGIGPHSAGEESKAQRGTYKVAGNKARVHWSPDCKSGLGGLGSRALPPLPACR